MTKLETQAVQACRQWLEEVVIGLNLCPFAAREWQAERVRFIACEHSGVAEVLEALALAMRQLQLDETIETSLLVLANGFADFESYLDLLELAEALLERQDPEQEFQIASFHPQYLFADSEEGDPANYSNRSPYPMLHLLREASVSRAVDGHPDIDSVPAANVERLRSLGLSHMQALVAACRPKVTP